MVKWEKVLRVKERKIKQAVIKPVEGVGTIRSIVEKDFVQVVVSGEPPNFVNQVGEIDIDHLMGIRVFIDRISY